MQEDTFDTLLEQISIRHDFAITFSKKISKKEVEQFRDDLMPKGFMSVLEKAEEGEHILLLSLENHEQILKEAEREKLSQKICVERKLTEAKKAAPSNLHPKVALAEELKPISNSEKHDLYCTISEADRIRISYNILCNIKLNDLLNTSMYFMKLERLNDDEGAIDFFQRHGLVTEILALHSKSRAIRKMLNFKDKEDGTLLEKAMKGWFVPVDQIRDYYGDEIAIYFEWMNFFLRWISVPAAMGLIIKTTNSFLFEDVSKSPLNALFSIVMAVWAALFSVNWLRHQRGLRILWDNLYNSEHQIEHIRKDFVGVPTINQISQKVEPHFSDSQRMIKYIESTIICMPFFAIVFVFLVCCYNITGVIIPDSKYDQFHIIFLADLALPGAIFDCESNMAYVTTIGQVILTMLLNMYFREVAIYCTNRENHKYKSTYENSLLLKRFVFEFFDCFLPLIYFGWWEMNFKVLRQNVISLYVADELRRIFCETILPYLMQNKSKITKDMYTLALRMQKKETQSEIEKHMQEGLKQMIDKKAMEDKMKKLAILEELEEFQRDEHEIFDDYLEFVVSFGYITMFASVFTFGATCIFVFIMLESRSDIFKLENNLRRPIPTKTYHIGSWTKIIEVFCILSIFSNIIISCYASDQIDYLLPWLSEYRDNKETSVMTAFCLEHILLFVVAGIRLRYDCNPEWVDIYLARRTYRLEKK